ncbi:unnamed protein product [Dicrocoelium dendriticum]|nr:unnamed protein product [Dicrocoelium dendriticum]
MYSRWSRRWYQYNRYVHMMQYIVTHTAKHSSTNGAHSTIPDYDHIHQPVVGEIDNHFTRFVSHVHAEFHLQTTVSDHLQSFFAHLLTCLDGLSHFAVELTRIFRCGRIGHMFCVVCFGHIQQVYGVIFPGEFIQIPLNRSLAMLARIYGNQYPTSLRLRHVVEIGGA